MGDLRTLAGALLGLTFAAQGTQARVDALAREFAVCTGRLTAGVEHRWLFGLDAAAAERDRDAMMALLQAVLAPEDWVAATAALVEARLAMAALLSQSAFAGDQRRRDQAARQAAALAAACTVFLLHPAGA